MENTKQVVGFGTNEALKGETPKGIKWVYRGLMIASAAFTLVISTYPEIPEHVQLQVLKALTLLNGMVYMICQQFGWVVKKD